MKGGDNTRRNRSNKRSNRSNKRSNRSNKRRNINNTRRNRSNKRRNNKRSNRSNKRRNNKRRNRSNKRSNRNNTRRNRSNKRRNNKRSKRKLNNLKYDFIQTGGLSRRLRKIHIEDTLKSEEGLGPEATVINWVGITDALYRDTPNQKEHGPEGCGGYGCVVIVSASLDEQPETEYALKVLELGKKEDADPELKEIEKEIQILEKLGGLHKHWNTNIGISLGDRSGPVATTFGFIVIDYYNSGNLKMLINETTGKRGTMQGRFPTLMGGLEKVSSIWSGCAGIQKQQGEQPSKTKILNSVSMTSKLIGDLISALEHAHSMDIVHFDLKPENIMLHYNPVSNAYSLHLIDFGLAIDFQQNVDADPGTRGTLDYVSPMLFYGYTDIRQHPTHADSQTTVNFYKMCDVYSMSCILYKMFAIDDEDVPWSNWLCSAIDSVRESLPPSFMNMAVDKILYVFYNAISHAGNTEEEEESELRRLLESMPVDTLKRKAIEFGIEAADVEAASQVDAVAAAAEAIIELIVKRMKQWMVNKRQLLIAMGLNLFGRQMSDPESEWIEFFKGLIETKFTEGMNSRSIWNDHQDLWKQVIDILSYVLDGASYPEYCLSSIKMLVPGMLEPASAPTFTPVEQIGVDETGAAFFPELVMEQNPAFVEHAAARKPSAVVVPVPSTIMDEPAPELEPAPAPAIEVSLPGQPD